MTFRKGDPRPAGAGRVKGKPTRRQMLLVPERLLSRGKNPVDELLILIPQMEVAEAAKTWLALLAYCTPKPREQVQPATPAAEPTTYGTDLSDEALEEAAVEGSRN